MTRNHATQVTQPARLYPYNNATFLDEFYIAAHAGWDFETGEVVDHDREAATTRDMLTYGHHVEIPQ